MRVVNIYIFIFFAIILAVPLMVVGFVEQPNGSSFVPQSLNVQHNYPDIHGDVEKAAQNIGADSGNNGEGQQLTANFKENILSSRTFQSLSGASTGWLIFIFLLIMAALVVFWVKRRNSGR